MTDIAKLVKRLEEPIDYTGNQYDDALSDKTFDPIRLEAAAALKAQAALLKRVADDAFSLLCSTPELPHVTGHAAIAARLNETLRLVPGCTFSDSKSDMQLRAEAAEAKVKEQVAEIEGLKAASGRAAFDWLMDFAANNYHGRPSAQAECDVENKIITRIADEMLRSMSPEDHAAWKSLTEEISAHLAAEAKCDQMRAALEGITTFAWLAMQPDCDEARVELTKRIDACRAALSSTPPSPDWRALAKELVEALEEISIGAGPYKIDPLEHAAACIEDMKRIALAASAKARAAGLCSDETK